MVEPVLLDTFSSTSGHLTVYNNDLPGDIKRVFYIYGAEQATRGGHRHHRAWNALICLTGRCCIYIHDGHEERDVWLDRPDKCLVLAPTDWHVMHQFSADAILLVLSNEPYDVADYIDEPYPTSRYAASSAATQGAAMRDAMMQNAVTRDAVRPNAVMRDAVRRDVAS